MRANSSTRWCCRAMRSGRCRWFFRRKANGRSPVATGRRGAWELNAQGRVESPDLGSAGMADLVELRVGLEPVDVPGRYRDLEGAGIAYGPAFRGLVGLWSGHRRLFGRLLDLLDEAGVVSRDPAGGWLVMPGSQERLTGRPAFVDDAAGPAEHALLRRCGGALAEVLRGRADPLELLFGGEPSAGDLYSKSPAARALNRLVGETVEEAVSRLPEGRRLRLVEVGAGTGGNHRRRAATIARGSDRLRLHRYLRGLLRQGGTPFP